VVSIHRFGKKMSPVRWISRTSRRPGSIYRSDAAARRDGAGSAVLEDPRLPAPVGDVGQRREPGVALPRIRRERRPDERELRLAIRVLRALVLLIQDLPRARHIPDREVLGQPDVVGLGEGQARHLFFQRPDTLQPVEGRGVCAARSAENHRLQAALCALSRPCRSAASSRGPAGCGPRGRVAPNASRA
jgi:hypothetical protein